MKVNIECSKISIRQVFNEFQQGHIILKPSYQRDYVWSLDMRLKLIDSIEANLPIHDIVFANFSDRNLGYREVIDGKHRLSVIFECYQMTGGVAKRQLGLKPLNITEVINPTEEQVLEIYNRLNYLGVSHEGEDKR